MPQKKLRPYTPFETTVMRGVLLAVTVANNWIYRVSGGRIMGRIPGGAPILLLTTTGRKSGKPRTAALLYLEDGERLAIVGSQGGMAKHPLWVLNLQANPEVEVQVGREQRKMLARIATSEEKATLWPRLAPSLVRACRSSASVIPAAAAAK